MKTPPLLTGAALLFWGWQADMLAFAAPMAGLLELSRPVSWRWDLTDRDFNRLADLCNLLFLGAAVWLFARDGAHGVFSVVRLLPLLLYLLVLAQAYSTRGALNLSSLFLSLRRFEAKETELPPQRIDLGYPYLAACVIAAGVDGHREAGFFAGAFALTAWSLAAVRPRRYPLWVWLALLMLAATLGWGGQVGIRQLQFGVERMVAGWFHDRWWQDRDPYHTRTAIGHIGRLKLSERIAFRVRLDGRALDQNPLLRQASYQRYRNGSWQVGPAEFRPVSRGYELGSWRLASAQGPTGQMEIAGYLRDGRGLLPLPGAATEVRGLLAASLRANDYGTVRVDEAPEFSRYRVLFEAQGSRDRPPESEDLRVPEPQKTVIDRVARDLGLSVLEPREQVQRIGGFFQSGFRYALFQERRRPYMAPLAEFLLVSRQGHCEYFATATVLLLRAAGVPARYATGYALQEPEGGRGRFVVRHRHAHAWALAYLDGAWEDVDFTPAVWAEREAEQAPWWLPAYDLLSWTAFELARWRAENDLPWGLAAWVSVPLALLLAWRLRRRRSLRHEARAGNAPAPGAAWPGNDSGFHDWMRQLEKASQPRGCGETVLAWLRRVERGWDDPAALDRVREAAELHYRYRFDPAGLNPAERSRLRRLVQEGMRPGVDWLGRLRGPMRPEGRAARTDPHRPPV
jgi:hypothetical protein